MGTVRTDHPISLNHLQPDTNIVMAEFTNFGDKVVIVTGAGGMLGGGCAVQLAKYGAKVALLDVDQAKLNDTVSKCKAVGLASSKILAIKTDVTDKEQAQRAVDAAAANFNKVDVLINIVGVKRLGNLETCDIDDLDTTLNGCVRGTFIMCKAVLPHLMQTKGSIVNMSSVSGLRAYHFGLPYGTAKAAVNHMTRIMAAGLAKHGIRVNAVAPSLIKPDDPSIITEAMQKGYDICSRAVPFGRVGEMDELVKTVLYLASPSAGFITGQVLAIDGAYSQTLYEPPN